MIIDFSIIEKVHKTGEEWEKGEWRYFEEFCLEAKVKGSSVKIRVKMVEKAGNVWHFEYLVDGQNVDFIFLFK